MQLVIAQTETAVQEVIAFADQLHDGILYAIVHHLYIMSGRAFTQVSYAGYAANLGGHGFQQGLYVWIGFGITARHDAGTRAGALLTAGDADTHKMEAFLLHEAHPAKRVRIM